MTRVAGFSVVADNWFNEKDKDTVSFNVPAGIDTNAHAVLGFMLKVRNLDDMSITIRINGTKAWTWTCNGSSEYPARFWQEVIGPGVLKAGTNVFSVDSSSVDYRLLEMSDIVVWWQKNI